jgi:hypothetical protein
MAVADFQGDWIIQSEKYRIILEKLLENSYIIYYHLTQKEFTSKSFM